jgi:hypothetical protein
LCLFSDKSTENFENLTKKPTVTSLINASAPYERIIIGGESDKPDPRNVSKRLPQEVMAKFQDKSREVRNFTICLFFFFFLMAPVLLFTAFRLVSCRRS